MKATTQRLFHTLAQRACLAICLIVLGTVLTNAQGVVSGGVYKLRNQCSGKLVDVSGASLDNGALVHQWVDLGQPNQLWKIESIDSGYYKLTAQHSQKVLDVSNAGTANQTRIQQWDWANVANQQWLINDEGNGSYELEARHAPGQVLDLSFSNPDSGAQIWLYQRNNTCAQRWQLELVNGSPAKDTSYFGFNNNSELKAQDIELGAGSVRTGIGADVTNIRREGDQGDFTSTDAYILPFFNAGLKPHAVISFRFGVDCSSGMTQWFRNYRYFVRKAAAHYKNTVRWYIVDNEPDLPYGDNCLQSVTAEQAFEFQKAAYQEIKNVDSGIIVESTPPMSPNTDYLRRLIQLGITDYADVLGTHVYGGQIYRDDMRAPWDWMTQYGVRRIPVVCSECSAPDGDADQNGIVDTFFDPNVWSRAQTEAQQKQWFGTYSYIRMKRFGYSHALLFDLNGTGMWGVFIGDSVYNNFKRVGFVKQGLTNGNFEGSNDPATAWVVYPNNEFDKEKLINLSNPVVNGNASGARNGAGYLRVNGEADRVFENLTPGKKYRVEVYANRENGGMARLKAMGYNHLNGTEEQSAAMAESGWVKLSVELTPTKTWVVLGLQSDGDYARFDDLTITRLN